jgi:CheY-like chemotaxis protein
MERFLDAEHCASYPECLPGEYVVLIVSDDGRGMDKETQSHLFEPFFTTKKVGEGTGLGLATVYGIVKQNNGFITVDSEPGKGSTFTISFPRQTESEPAHSAAAEVRGARGGAETLLVVEDEQAILSLSKTILGLLGYTVLAARLPEEALAVARAHDGPIHLLIADVVMPQMNGRELSAQIAALKPGIRSLFISGHTADVIGHQGVLEPGVQLISKPFSLTVLAQKVREILG